MKRTFTCVLVIILMLSVLTSCKDKNPEPTVTTDEPSASVGTEVSESPQISGETPTFVSVDVSDERIINGTVLNGDPAGQRLFIYLSGGASDGFQSDAISNRYLFDEGGSFQIEINDNSAETATIYLATRNVDQSSRQTVEKGSLAQITIVLPPSSLAETYIVSYEDGLGNVLPIETVKFKDVTKALTDYIPKRDGYVFLGWSTDPGAAVIKYAPESNYSQNVDVTLYAIWKLDDGSGVVDDDDVESSSSSGGDVGGSEGNDGGTQLGSGVIPSSSFILLADDGAKGGKNAFNDTAYMGMNENGTDGSIGANINDTSKNPIVGRTAMKFSYTPINSDAHWSGVALLWKTQGWNEEGPDLKAYTKMTFWVCGNGGRVKFFIEGDGFTQKTCLVSLTEDWQKITLDIGNWEYINVPFGWACSESDPDQKGGTITFWVDGVHFS